MATTNPSGKSLSNSIISRKHAVAKTKELLLRGPQQGENVLVQPTPTVHPERLIPELVDAHNLLIVFIAPTDTQLKRMKRRCRALNLSTREISSPYSRCPSYNGQHGDAVEEQVEAALEQGVPLGRLHKTRDLPCCPNCPFTSWKRPEFTEQVVLANPRHAYISSLLEERVVFTCALRGDAYITEIENPPHAVDSYLDTNTEFTGYHDFIRNRDSDRAPSIWDYADGAIDPSTDDEEFGYAIDKDGHHLAPLALFGLVRSQELPNGWETSHHRYNSKWATPTLTYNAVGGRNPFEVAGLDYQRHRVVREPGETPEDDTLYVLKVPDYSKAKSVVAFDVAPTPWMWRTYYGVNFDHQRVYSDAETAEFLRDEMGVEVVQTATSRKPYGSKNVTPGRDASIAIWATAEFGKRPLVVSTKNALGRYRSKQPALLKDDAKDGIQYGRGESVITDDAPLIIVNGSPRPKTKEFQLWGALAGKSVRNQNQSFGQTGDEIRSQFSESRVGKWATRFDSRNATVVLNTTATPEWLRNTRLVWLRNTQLVTQASPTNILSGNASGQREVARYLRDKNGSRAKMTDIQTGADVSENTARRARNLFTEQGWVAKHATEGREPDEYSWVA
ncbi:hypothetical protein [Halostella pelagica]|uniref:hypothetical protein n=1 Tax=Halostella pelagica TaxID=2583824 RepID=UPI0010817EFF|nr:hypothetical protein [Halostella pelagica]